jgi:hypothetical protein
MDIITLPDRLTAPGRIGFRSRGRAAPAVAGPTPGTRRAALLTAPSRGTASMRP